MSVSFMDDLRTFEQMKKEEYESCQELEIIMKKELVEQGGEMVEKKKVKMEAEIEPRNICYVQKKK